jgi:PAS domain S-box-containing protein
VVDLDQIGRAILHSSADAIIAADRNGTIQFWNPGAERLFGFRSDQALGCSLDIIIPETLRARHWEGYRRVMATGETRYGAGDILAVPALRQDGTRVSLEFTIVPLRDSDGQLAGVAAILRDVTRRFEEIRSLKQRLAGVMPPQVQGRP